MATPTFTSATLPVLSTMVMTMTACFLPPSLSPESEVDAGVNATPVIIATDTNFPAPGPILIDRQQASRMNLTVRDLDTQDTIYIFFYVNYNYPNPVPFSNRCQSSARQIDRTLSCPLNGLCAQIAAPDEQIHFLEAMVTDRELLDDAQEPAFRAVPVGTGISYQSWLMRCTEAL